MMESGQRTLVGPWIGIVCCITKDRFMYPILVIFSCKYLILDIIMCWPVTLDSQKPTRWSTRISTGQDSKNLWQTISGLAIFAEETEYIATSPMGYSSNSQFHHSPGNPSQWISSSSYPHQEAVRGTLGEAPSHTAV